MANYDPPTTIRLNAEEKLLAQRILASKGMTLSQAVRLFVRHVVRTGEIPNEIIDELKS